MKEEASGVRFTVGPMGQCNGSAKEFSETDGSELSAVRELVRLNFGEMAVASRTESGTTFSLTILRWNPRQLADRFLGDLDHRRQRRASAALAIIELKLPEKPETLDLADEFLQRIFRSTDLVLPVSPAKWLVAALDNVIKEPARASVNQ